jgi:hypothetical protein
MPWFVQVKYARHVPAQGPDGWVTVAVAEQMRDAGREGAFVYRERQDANGRYPTQVRIRREDQLRSDGGVGALGAALASLVACSERVAAEAAPDGSRSSGSVGGNF